MNIRKVIIYCMLIGCCSIGLNSCSDDPDANNYYVFNGEMMSEYLQHRPQYSMFTEVVTRAGLIDQLSAYGHYTCFCPNNEAMDRYLKSRGISAVSDLTVADCDTLARTHLVNVMYSTFEMKDGVLASQNMNRRPLEISHGVDKNDNAVVIINGEAEISFELQDDSVENGIMQPINEVLESSNRLLPDLIGNNDKISIYYAALKSTGLSAVMNKYKDDSYPEPDATSPNYFHDYISGASNHEAATPPDQKLYGYTAFVVTDSVLQAKYNVKDLRGLYDLACKYYDVIYPDDKNLPEHSFENLDSPKNPLYRFIAYHILNRNVQGWNFLTVRDDFGIYTEKMNPTEWYETLLPYTMMKVEHLTVRSMVGAGTLNERYINRRYDNQYQIEGCHIQQNVDPQYDRQALNGLYFYIDEVLAYTPDVRDIVFNCRIRIDFSALFPELMTNNMRMNGDRTHDDDNFSTSYDHTFKYGRNYYFPDGYLDGVKVGGNGYFIYRRPHQNYWSYNGDEFDCQGNYDVTFRIPPVAFEGEYQIRLGYAAMEGLRGVAQIYFDDIPQGIPLDMNKDLRNPSLLGDDYSKNGDYTSMTDEEKQEDRKTLKNKGYYRGANGAFHTNGSTKYPFSNEYATIRIVLCTVHIAPGEDHYLRLRAVSSKQGNDNEAMLDYLEIVPRSVYGVTDEGSQEDDL